MHKTKDVLVFLTVGLSLVAHNTCSLAQGATSANDAELRERIYFNSAAGKIKDGVVINNPTSVDLLGEYIRKHPASYCYLNGYADNGLQQDEDEKDKDQKFAQELSQARLEEVKKQLLEKNVPVDRIILAPRGTEDNAGMPDKASQRRVEAHCVLHLS